MRKQGEKWTQEDSEKLEKSLEECGYSPERIKQIVEKAKATEEEPPTEGGEKKPEGNEPEGNEPEGNEPEGNEPEGNEPKKKEPVMKSTGGEDPEDDDPEGDSEIVKAVKVLKTGINLLSDALGNLPGAPKPAKNPLNKSTQATIEKGIEEEPINNDLEKSIGDMIEKSVKGVTEAITEKVNSSLDKFGDKLEKIEKTQSGLQSDLNDYLESPASSYKSIRGDYSPVEKNRLQRTPTGQRIVHANKENVLSELEKALSIAKTDEEKTVLRDGILSLSTTGQCLPKSIDLMKSINNIEIEK